MKNILILTSRPSDLTEAIRFAFVTKASGRFNPVIIDMSSNTELDDFKKKLIKDNDVTLYQPTLRNFIIKLGRSAQRKIQKSSTNRKKIEQKKFNKFLSFLLSRLRIPIYNIIGVPFIFILTRLIFRSAIRRYRPDLLVVTEDVVGIDLPSFIQIGQKKNIPTLIVPYTVANASEAYEALKNKLPFCKDTWIYKLVKLIFPLWRFEKDGNSLLRLPIPYVIMHEILNLTPPDPWTMNSGFSQAIAVESKKMIDYYEDEGFLKDRLRLTGCLADDQMYQIRQNRSQKIKQFTKRIGIKNDKPLILFAAPPNQNIDGSRCKFEFDSYEEALKFIANNLCIFSEKYNIIVRPHPNFSNIKNILKDYSLTITLEDTAQLIALSDIYIASASATIRWAIACGVPTINYDLFHYNYPEYLEERGVVNISRKEDFTYAVKELCADPEYYKNLKIKQELSAKNWSEMDGNSADRIMALCDTLIQNQKIERSPNSVGRKAR